MEEIQPELEVMKFWKIPIFWHNILVKGAHFFQYTIFFSAAFIGYYLVEKWRIMFWELQKKYLQPTSSVYKVFYYINNELRL